MVKAAAGADSLRCPDHGDVVESWRRIPKVSRRRAPKRAGRPIGFTIDTALKVGFSIGRYESLDAVARRSGIGVSTQYRWIKSGLFGDPRSGTLIEVAKQ
jgi:hypothetical protein